MNGKGLAHIVPLAAPLAGLLLAACAVGPDFHKPAAPDVSGYTAHPPSTTAATANVAGGTAQRFVKGSDISGEWWTLFHSRPVDALIKQALANNPDFKAAQAALAAAKEDVLAQRGAYYPSVSGSLGANRAHDPSAALAPVPSNNAFQYNLFTTQIGVSYVPDVFGLNRRTVESLQAQEQAVRFQMIATYNTLTANVVVAAIQEAALQAQIDATRKLIDIGNHALKIVKYQFSKGYASKLDVASQAAQLAQVKAGLPGLVKQMAWQHNLLAVLVGRFPGQAPPATFKLATLHLPEQLPVSLPSALVAQRPDVRQAQANLHAASAQVGIATANRLPQIQLTGDVGSMALTIGKLFTTGSGFWGLAAALTAPIFEGGTLMHQQRAARATYTEAAAQYRSTVLTAFQNVADTLAALEQDAKSLKAAAAAAKAAQTTLDLSQRQFRNGYASELSLLSAEQSWQQAHANLVEAQANRYIDTVALFQALGGGWWHRPKLAKDNDE
ncbi:MAG TPA: efflux transporter outer membrane subunit [Gammaproteobacteria bacterium]|nr:efflux transporter outer membrane subunit [Gammaproteobacteria bacterium]